MGAAGMPRPAVWKDRPNLGEFAVYSDFANLGSALLAFLPGMTDSWFFKQAELEF